VNFLLRTADSGGDPAPTKSRTAGPHSGPARSADRSPAPGRNAWRWLKAALLPATVAIFAACGVQAPPQPPRVEIPQQIKDLRTIQTGRTLNLTFTLPVLATDGENLTKPVQIDVFRAVSPTGQKPATPDTNAAPCLSLTAKELPRYTIAGKVDYPFQLSPQEFRQSIGSAFSFAVVAFTRGFMGHPRRSLPSNVVSSRVIDVTKPVTNLTVKTTQTALVLTWSKPAETLTGAPPAHLSGYRISTSATGKPGSFQPLAETTATHFDDKIFQFGKTYHYRVSAVSTLDGSQAESAPSAAVSVTPRDVFPPPAPTGLTAVNAAGAVDLLWNASSSPDLAGYNVYRSTDGGPFERVNKKRVPTPIFHDTSVEPGHHYQYAITAIDLSGNESARSKPATVTTRSSGAH